MSVHNVFGVNLRHSLYDVDEVLLEEDAVQLTTSHVAFLLTEQLGAFVSGSKIVSTPGLAAHGQGGGGVVVASPRDLEARSVVQAPLWVARALVPRQHAVMNVPEAYSAASLKDFRAGAFLPLVASSKGDRFFDLGVAVSAFLPAAAAKSVRESAIELYRKRYFDVLMEGYKKGNTGTRDAQLRAKLTTREQALYTAVARDIQWRNEWRRWLHE